MSLALLQLPNPRTESIPLGGQIWRITLHEEYDSFFKNEHEEFDADIRKTLEKFVSSKFKQNYRVQVHLKATPFLVGILFDQKEILITSTRMNRELFLIQEIEKGKLTEELTDEQAKRFKALVEHVHKMISIDMRNAPTTIEQITRFYDLPDFMTNRELHKICERSWKLEEELTEQMEEYKPTFFERLTDVGLNMIAKYGILRIHLLKFIALLPSLDHNKGNGELKRSLLETLHRMLADSERAGRKKKKGEWAPLPRLYLYAVKANLFICRFVPSLFLAKGIRLKVRLMAKRFIAGEKIENIEKGLFKLYNTGRDVTLDQLGERVVSSKEADCYLSNVMKLIRGFRLHVTRGETNKAGLPKAHISVKLSALAYDFNPHAREYVYNQVAPRLKKILVTARRENVFVHLDAEHYAYRDVTFYIYRRVLLETDELKSFSHTGIVIQAYLRDAYPHFQEVLELAKERKIRMPVRLVKGAYWDAETIEAKAHAFDPPEFINKEETDIHFRQLIYKALEAGEHVQLCLGSHNLTDHAFAETLAKEAFPDAPPIEHQCLHMTFEPLSWGMAEMGWSVRNYMTVGSLLAGMAYLVRRILENSSQAGVLVQMRTHLSEEKTPFPQAIHQEKKSDGKVLRDPSVTGCKPYFVNTIPVRLYKENERSAFEKSFQHFTDFQLGSDVSKDGYSGETHKVYSPSNPKVLVGQIQRATEEDAFQAVESAHIAYTKGEWAKAKPLERISVLLKAADAMLLHRLRLASLIIHEGGKNVTESINDVNEAIDFIHFYAKEEARLNKLNPKLVSRGVFAVISPWNFPLAIPTGMATSALAAGNTVILKPAEHTPLITQAFTEILYAAGIPKDVFTHLPGPGSAVGRVLVEHEKVCGIVFTGSKQVGLSIAHTAGKKMNHNYLYHFDAPTKVITEMGGKNAIIVTATAELDEAVVGILYSAFGNAGQKCSAASRVIVDNAIKDRLTERLKEACRDIQVGPAFNPSTYINPLIAFKEKERLKRAAKEAGQEANLYGGEVLLDRSGEELPGYCMGPVLITLPMERALHPESFSKKELFGPILHVIGYDKVKEAVRLFNATEYGLTGGIYSQSQNTVETLQRKLEAGNIYVNRHCTGARVAIEPFGGFKLSGTGPKAGSTVYLDAFHVDLASVETNRQKPIAIDMEGIAKFKTFIAKSLPQFVRHRYWNRKIPGQLSFNDLSQIKELGFYVALEDEPNTKTLFYFLAALAVGSRVRVLALTEQSLTTWSLIVDFLLESGFTKEDVTIAPALLENIKHKTRREDPYFLIVEGGTKEIQMILNEIYDETFDEHHMRTILTKLDAPSPGDFKRYLEQFVQVRSFAVNTMRHGAPLELEL